MLFGAMIGQTITDLFSMDKNQDGNISRFEAMQAILGLGGRLTLTLPKLDIQKALEEFKTGGSEAREAAMDELRANFDLPDEELEALIEDTTILIEKYISTGTELYGETVDLIGRYKVRYATPEVPAEFALPPAA